MTVKKLIEELQKMPPNAQVVFDSSEPYAGEILLNDIEGVRHMCFDNGKNPVLIFNHDTSGRPKDQADYWKAGEEYKQKQIEQN